MASRDDKVATAAEHEGVPKDDVPRQFEIVPIEEEAAVNAQHVELGWRSWLVVFITSFTVGVQTFVVVAAGQVITFIVRDLGDAPLAGWIIQGPLLMQSVLSPIVGRLSDVLDRKYLSAVPPLVAVAGSVLSAKATSMAMLIVGGILIGTTLATVAVVHSIPSEVLPLKYRTVSNGCCMVAGCLAGLIGSLGAGAVTSTGPGGWRWIFWMQAIFHSITALGLFLFYWPPKGTVEFPKMSVWKSIWTCDPIGSVLFMGSTALILLGLDWAGGSYAWSSAHVAAPLAVGLVAMVLFGLYEWKGRPDGLVAHVFFRNNLNFALSVFAFGVEGWVFYSAVNSITPALSLQLGFEDNSWRVAIRQLSFTLPNLFFAAPSLWYATKYKDLKSPLIITFTIFLVVTICYACIQPSWVTAQYGLNILMGLGQSGPLALLASCIQFASPHAYLSTATGLGYSGRAIGGAFGSAVLNAIINGRIRANYAAAVGAAAVEAGLPESSVEALVGATQAGKIGDSSVQGATPAVWSAAVTTHRDQYAAAYRVAWASIVPFVFLAIIAVASLRSVEKLMTERVEATVEKDKAQEGSGEEGSS